MFEVEVQIPGGTSNGFSDVLLLSARSDNDGGTRGYTMLTTQAVPEPGSLMLAITAAAGVSLVAWKRRRKV